MRQAVTSGTQGQRPASPPVMAGGWERSPGEALHPVDLGTGPGRRAGGRGDRRGRFARSGIAGWYALLSVGQVWADASSDKVPRSTRISAGRPDLHTGDDQPLIPTSTAPS